MRKLTPLSNQLFPEGVVQGARARPNLNLMDT